MKQNEQEKIKTVSLVDAQNLTIIERSIQNDRKIWLTEKEARVFLSVSKSTLRKYRLNLDLKFSQRGAKIYYKMEDLVAFLEVGYTGRRVI